VNILLDTHIFLWYISKDKRLPANWRDSIRNLDNQVFLSVVSLWEAIVKYQLGKLPLPDLPEVYLPAQRQKHQIASLDLDEGSVSHLRNSTHSPRSVRSNFNMSSTRKRFNDCHGG
jgi:PIN domain nuclease of toxin-antitoxin system